MTITVMIYSLLILLLFFVGMDYLDPPPENGIAINFGATETGSRITPPKELLISAPNQTIPPPVVESKAEQSEALVTQDVEEAPVIKKEKNLLSSKSLLLKKRPQKKYLKNILHL